MKLLKKGIVVFLLFFSLQVSSQNYLNMHVSLHIKNASVVSAFRLLEEQLSFNFSYDTQLINEEKTISINADHLLLNEVLYKILGHNYDYKVVGTHVIIQGSLPPINKQNDKFSFTGQVLDANNQPLENAIIYEANRKVVSITNYDGFYVFNLVDDEQPLALNISRNDFKDTVVFVKKELLQDRPKTQITKHWIKPLKSADYKNLSIPVKTDIHEISNIKLAKILISDDALYISNNLNIFNWQAIQVSFLPNIGTNNLMNGVTSNNVSFNVISGYTSEIKGVEFGAISNFVHSNVTGFQAGGVSNIVGKDINGVQCAGVMNITLGNVNGAQIAGVANQLNGRLNGVQISGAINTAISSKEPSKKGFKGQISSVSNIHLKDTTNLQITSVYNQAEKVSGVQISAACNYTKKLTGAQIGIVNIADTIENGVPIGLINIVKYGYKVFEISTNETFKCNIAFKAGGQNLYSYLFAGFDKYISAGYGFGYTTNYLRKYSFNIDLSGGAVADPNAEINSYMGTNFRLQPGFNLHLAKHLTISTGPAYNFFLLYGKTGAKTSTQLDSKGLYNGNYYLQKAINSHKNQSWFGWFFSLKF